MPYGTVNLLRGVANNETPETCTAGVGTFILEFGALSRLTGNPVYERKAMRALLALNARKSEIGLVSVQAGNLAYLENMINLLLCSASSKSTEVC